MRIENGVKNAVLAKLSSLKKTTQVEKVVSRIKKIIKK